MDFRISDTTEASVKGSFALLVGSLISYLVTAIGSIIVARMLEPSELGLFTIALVLPTFFNLFSTWGIRQALIRYIARNRSQNSSEDNENLIQAGYIFRFVLGSLLSIVLFLSSNILSTTLLRKPGVAEFVKLSSALVLTQSLHGVNIAIFTGYENMKYRSIVNVFQSVIKGIVSPLLVYFGYGVSGVIIGHTVSFVGSTILGVILVVNLLGGIPRIQSFETFKKNLLLLLSFGFPLFIGNFMMGVSNQFRGFLFSWFVPEVLVGNYGIASWFNAVVGLLSQSLGATFLPMFSKFDVNSDSARTKELFQGSIRYSTIFLVPIICMLIFTTKPVIYLLFGDKYPHAPFYLSLLLVPTLLVSLGSLSIPRYLNSQAETRATMIINLITSTIGIGLNFVFLWKWGVEGLLTSFILSSLVQNFLGRQIIQSKYDIMPSLGHAGRILLCCLIAGGVSSVTQQYFKTRIAFVDLLISALSYLIPLLLLAPNLGAITRKDSDSIDFLFRKMPLIYPIIRLILSLIEKVRL